MPLVSLLATLALAPPPLLAFRGLLESRSGRLTPSARLQAAAGTRVRMRGFVADMEMAPKGGFWLLPSPLQADESGGGTADLPPESVFVVVRSSPVTAFRSPNRPVEVTGMLELGPKPLPDGTMTRLRLVLDREAPKAPPSRRPARSVPSRTGRPVPPASKNP